MSAVLGDERNLDSRCQEMDWIYVGFSSYLNSAVFEICRSAQVQQVMKHSEPHPRLIIRTLPRMKYNRNDKRMHAQ